MEEGSKLGVSLCVCVHQHAHAGIFLGLGSGYPGEALFLQQLPLPLLQNSQLALPLHSPSLPSWSISLGGPQPIRGSKGLSAPPPYLHPSSLTPFLPCL